MLLALCCHCVFLSCIAPTRHYALTIESCNDNDNDKINMMVFRKLEAGDVGDGENEERGFSRVYITKRSFFPFRLPNPKISR